MMKMIGSVAGYMIAWVRDRNGGSNVTRKQENLNHMPSHRVTLLNRPICNTHVPMAMSTKRIFQRHQEVISKLKSYLRE